MERPNNRTVHGYGAVPKHIADDKDTEPNLFAKGGESFGGPVADEATAPRCYLCGRHAWAYDDGFEAGIAFALTQVQGLLQTGKLGSRLEPEDAAALVQWLRGEIQGKR